MSIIDPIALITSGGLIMIATIVFLEIGFLPFFIFPGDSLLFAGGYLSAEGYFSIWALILIVAIATILGGFVAYFTGKKISFRFSEKPPRFIKPSYIERTNKFYEKYGPRAILLMRFVPVVRTIAPLLAGVGGMRLGTFTKYNIMGGFLWAIPIPLLGFFFGRYVPNLDHYVSMIMLIVIGVSILFMIWSVFPKPSK